MQQITSKHAEGANTRTQQGHVYCVL